MLLSSTSSSYSYSEVGCSMLNVPYIWTSSKQRSYPTESKQRLWCIQALYSTNCSYMLTLVEHLCKKMLTCKCGGPWHKLSANRIQQLDTKTKTTADEQTYFMVDLKKCCMCFGDVKRLWFQKSSADACNDLLVGAAGHWPEWHTACRWNFAPLSSGKILTTLNTKLQQKAVTNAEMFQQKVQNVWQSLPWLKHWRTYSQCASHWKD